MKANIKSLLLLMSFAVTSVISCQNEPMASAPESADDDSAAGRLATVDMQIAAVKSSVADVTAVLDGIDLYVDEVTSITSQMLDDMKAIGVKSDSQDDTIASMKSALETEKTALAAEAKAMEEFVASVTSGADWGVTTLSTMERQKSLAEAIGSLEYTIEALGDNPSSVVTKKALRDAYDKCLKGRLDELEASVSTWIGEPFEAYFAMMADGAEMSLSISAYSGRLQKQFGDIENLGSVSETSAMKASVEKNMKTVTELESVMATFSADMEKGYKTAVSKAVANNGNVDAAAIDEVNEAAEVKLMSTGTSLADLSDRILVCEAEIADLQARLEAVEGSLDEMLGLIQSVTFVSEGSAEVAAAYYQLSATAKNETRTECAERIPSGEITLNYLVRPASAAEAFASSDIWTTDLKVIGYYAPHIRLASVSAADMIDFNITGVSADAETGLVTVTVENSLSEAFYYKETGAKLALSVTSGKSDLTTRFVEIVPVDESGKVYVETLTLSDTYVEVDEEQTVRLKTTITPANPTDATIVWTSSNNEVATVSADGVVSALAEGEAIITATAGSTDEWGQTLSATCTVKVVPNIKLVAPGYVEVGGTLEIRVDSPNYIDPQYIKWSSSNTYYATVDDNGVVTGAVMSYTAAEKTYADITITCTIGDYNPTILTHVLKVVAPQPKGIRIASLGDNVNQKTIKIAEEFSLAGTIIPDAAASYFRLFYQARYGGNDAVASINYQTGKVTATSPGSVTFGARVLNDDDKGLYYFPAGTEVWRDVTVTVEPYWVKSVSIPETYAMTPGQTAGFTPVFESDVDGVQPTYKDLVWVSSNPAIVKVDSATGEMTAVSEGSAEITATTGHDWSVPSGESPKTAKCVVTVETPTDPIAIGDYYYTDGTWSTKLDTDKEVVGVIYATTSAVASDPLMLKDYPTCTHGLVVSLKEYADQDPGTVSTYYGHGYFVSLGYDAALVVNTDKPLGYYNTVARDAYCDAHSTETTLFDKSTGVLATQENTVKRSEESSSWYIPSYKEMSLMCDNLSKINAAITAAGGTQISNVQYWSSTIKGEWYEKGQSYDHYKYTFNVANNGWHAYIYNSGTYPVRVVLAF